MKCNHKSELSDKVTEDINGNCYFCGMSLIKTMKNKNAVALGSIKTEKKAKSSRLNGKKGGRPRKAKIDISTESVL